MPQRPTFRRCAPAALAGWLACAAFVAADEPPASADAARPNPPATAATPTASPTSNPNPTSQASTPAPGDARTMELGNFSVSLTVKNLEISRAFYEKLGFRPKGGDAEQGWLILQNDTATIGLFQGMFEKNMLTFNPGWNRKAETVDGFTDVRELQKRLLDAGVELTMRADESSTGPASFMLVDPDGNPILVDQHVAKPVK